LISNWVRGYTVPGRIQKYVQLSELNAAKSSDVPGEAEIGDAFRELHEETGFKGEVSYQKLLAQMYSDDTRNTDTTWICTSVYLIISDINHAVQADNRENSDAKWVPVADAFKTMGFYASHRQMIVAALTYYVTHSFREKGLEKTAPHIAVYEYLKDIPDLELPDKFSDLWNRNRRSKASDENCMSCYCF
jgi:ADP-ribose pyrophosphatase YjhB (NUDIX family)